jgi:hypothetical protein
MATKEKPRRPSKTLRHEDAAATIPSPAKVQATAAEIRDTWTPHQRRRRAQVARYMLLHQLLAPAQASRQRESKQPR